MESEIYGLFCLASFLFMADSSLVWIYHDCGVQSSVDGHLGFGLLNNAAVNTHV